MHPKKVSTYAWFAGMYSFVKVVSLHSCCRHFSSNRFLLYLLKFHFSKQKLHISPCGLREASQTNRLCVFFFIMHNSRCMKCQKMYSTCRNSWIWLGLHCALRFAPAMPDYPRVKICSLSNIIRSVYAQKISFFICFLQLVKMRQTTSESNQHQLIL